MGAGSLIILTGVLVHRVTRPLRGSVSCGSGWSVPCVTTQDSLGRSVVFCDAHLYPTHHRGAFAVRTQAAGPKTRNFATAARSTCAPSPPRGVYYFERRARDAASWACGVRRTTILVLRTNRLRLGTRQRARATGAVRRPCPPAMCTATRSTPAPSLAFPTPVRMTVHALLASA